MCIRDRYNHSSITLVEPFKNYFDTQFNLEYINEDDPYKKSELAYKMFLSQSVLATKEYMEFGRFEELFNSLEHTDLSIKALIEMHFRLMKKSFTKSQRKSGQFKRLEKRRKKIYNHVSTRYRIVNSSLDELESKRAFHTDYIHLTEEE